VALLQPDTLDSALDVRRAVPEAVVVAGGTEVMVARNRGERPGPLLDLSRVAELRETRIDRDTLRLGATVTLTRAIEELEGRLPVLAAASRTVASRQIRNRATIGGTVALADPSADVLTALVAAGADVELASADGTRRIDVAAFLTGPFVADVRPGELVTALHVPAATGPAAYAKVGARNAMARAICAVAVVLDLPQRRAVVAVANCGPAPVRTTVRWDGGELDPSWVAGVAGRVAQDIAPQDDDRGSAAYKRHAAAVLTRRALTRAWETPWV
jgi:CO/xanthine dehydrogenase FAD-binding subunit